MEIIKKTDSDVIAIKKFFGFKPNQTLKDFQEEYKMLTPDDRSELGNLIREKHGID